MKHMRKTVSLLLALVMVLGLLQMGTITARAVNVEVGTWNDLYNALQVDGNQIVLTADVAPADAYWGDALVVPSGVTVTLDLNGHIVDRGYRDDSTSIWDGSVIKIEGTLTVLDRDPTAAHDTPVTYEDPISGETVTVKGGVITGGWPDQYGGVYVGNGTFNLQGGTICGNRVGKVSTWGGDGLGAGVYVQNGVFNMSGGAICGNRAVGRSTIMSSDMGRGGGVYLTNGTFNMTGGSVTGNTAGQYGGGVYVASTYSDHDAVVNVSGGGAVTGNALSGAASNVYLEQGGIINVTGTLTGAIGVTMQTPGVFTSGLSGKGSADNITSDSIYYYPAVNDGGEAYLTTAYAIELTAGENMTLSSGDAVQSLEPGTAMTEVVYTADEGYYFPDPYSSAGTTNNVTVARESWTQITISGTPTASVEITLTAATAKTQEDTPAAAFTATGPDTGTLSGLTDGGQYAVTGAATAEFTASGTEQALTGVSAGTLSIVKKGNGNTTVDSSAQTIPVTKAEAPNLTATQPSAIGGTGSIPTTAAHQKSEDGTAWSDCEGAWTDLAADNTYYVRVKAAGTVLASDAQSITINAFNPEQEPTPTATFTATDADAGTLSDVTTIMKYSVDGGNTWLAITAVPMNITGVTAANGVKVYLPSTDADTRLDSEVQTIAVTKAATPNLAPTQPTTIGGTGSISTTAAHQKSTDGTTWTDCDGAWTGLAAGNIYYVRVKAVGTVLASDAQNITINPFNPGQEITPSAVFEAMGPDSGALTGFAAGEKYTLSGAGFGSTEITADAGGVYTIDADVSVGTLSIVKKGNGTTTVDSPAQTIDITKAATPTLEATQPTTIGGTGSIPTTAAHQKSTDSTTWTDCDGAWENLAADNTYYVRVKAAGTVLASDAQAITINAFEKVPQPDVPDGITVRDIGAGSVWLTGVVGEEYVIAPKGTVVPDWTAAITADESNCADFNGLDEATEYTVFARIAETDYYLPGAAITRDVTTYISSYGYFGEPLVGGTVSAPIDEVYDQTGVSYQWYLDGTAIVGATGASYVVQEGDAGKVLSVMPFKNGAPLWEEAYEVGEAHYATVNFYKEYKEDPDELELVQSVGGLKFGDTLQAPARPTRYGYNFAGWQEGVPGAFEDVAFPMIVEYSTDLYAKWTEYVYDPDPTPTVETVTVPVSGDDMRVNVTVQISGSTATITNANTDRVLEAEHVGTVVIDLSSLKDTVTEVVIPNGLLSKIADAVADEDCDADGMEIRLPGGSVDFDSVSLAAVAEQTDGKALTLTLTVVKLTELSSAKRDALKNLDVQIVLDVKLTGNGHNISSFKGGTATVSVPYELKDGQSPRGIVVWYVSDDGDRTEAPSTYDGKNVVFTVPHFSNYVIAYDAEKAAACPKDNTCPMAAFTDLDPTLWYHDGIHFCLENGMMNGVGDNKFNPSGTTNRAMIVTILYRLENEPNVSGKANPFDDVADGHWYTNAVIWAAENKIVEGYGNGKFGPKDNITREQLATILYRYAQRKGQGFQGTWMFLLDYPDASEISSWADEAMHWMVMNEIIKGKDGKLVPGGDASRAEAATMLMRYCTKIAE